MVDDVEVCLVAHGDAATVGKARHSGGCGSQFVHRLGDGEAARRAISSPVRQHGLTVVMGVQIDEAGCDEQTGRLDLAGADGVQWQVGWADGLVCMYDGGDDAFPHGHVTDEGVTTETVDDGAAANDEVECHASNVR